MTHQCDGEIDWCDECEARESAQAKPEAPKQAGTSLPVLPCGCVPPCEGHHEDES